MHTRVNVYGEMLLQVARDYGQDVRDFTSSQIRFFYNGLRAELRESTKPRSKK